MEWFHKVKPYPWPVALFTAGPAIAASLILWIAFQDNNNGEFMDTVSGRIDFRNAAGLWLAWFVGTFPIFILPAVLVLPFINRDSRN